MELNLTPAWLLATMVVSTVGFGFFLYGKKEARVPQLVVGIAMMIYPGFVASAGLMLTIGAALVGGLWLVVRNGG